jgi:DNA invertase Pin-like site-specific DNA recombinase
LTPSPRRKAFPLQAFQEVGSKVKTMADIRRIVDLYELYGSYKKVARELSISPNTAKKWSEPLRVDNELSNINSWREVHEKDEATLRPSIQDISSS